MVNHESGLDHVFAALGSTTRRRILGLLEEADERSVSDLAAPLGMKLPALLKQLGVLEDASLIKREKTGRTVRVRLAPQAIADAMAWLQRHERFWATRLDRSAAVAEKIEAGA